MSISHLDPLHWSFLLKNISPKEMIQQAITLYREHHHYLPTDVVLNSIHEKQYRSEVKTTLSFDQFLTFLPSDGVVVPTSIDKGIEVSIHFDASIPVDNVICLLQIPDEGM